MTNHKTGTVTDYHYLVDLPLKRDRKPLRLLASKLESLLLGTSAAEELFYEVLYDFIC